jgi:uncharacterized membrane protein (DUF106 family)
MTGSEIINIAITVGVVQLVCDLLAKYLVFEKEPYKRAVSALERAKWKLDKATADLAKNAKHQKRHKQAEDFYAENAAEVTRRHMGPGMLTSFLFVVLLRILGAEHKGKVMAILPFVPFNLLTRVTARGLNWGEASDMILDGSPILPKQAASFMFVYLLCTFSVKFFVHKAFGTPPPAGADRGILGTMDSPQGQKMMKQMGIDPEEYKEMTTF